eukprot:COSAG02_NODE_8213_length_2655_cov_3.093897_1_plen_129_part_00
MATTRAYWDNYRYLIDPHTAVCLAAADIAGLPRPGTVRTRKSFSPSCVLRLTVLRYAMLLLRWIYVQVCLSTAHPCKFEEALRETKLGDDFWQGSSGLAGTPHMPASAQALQTMDEIFQEDFLAVPGA